MADLLKISAVIYSIIVLATINYNLNFQHFFILSFVGAVFSGMIGAYKHDLDTQGRKCHRERLEESSHTNPHQN